MNISHADCSQAAVNKAPANKAAANAAPMAARMPGELPAIRTKSVPA